MITAPEIERAVCEALGLDPAACVSVTIELRAGQWPTVTVVHDVWDHEALVAVLKRYKLTDIDETEPRIAEVEQLRAALQTLAGLSVNFCAHITDGIGGAAAMEAMQRLLIFVEGCEFIVDIDETEPRTT